LNPASLFLRPAADALFFVQYLYSQLPALARAAGPIPQRLLQLLDVSAFVSVEPFQQLITDHVDFSKIRNSAKTLRIAATEIESGRVVVFGNDDMTDELGPYVVRASAAIPGVFPSVEIANLTYVDGGVRANTPLKYSIEAGATELHVIYMNPELRTAA